MLIEMGTDITVQTDIPAPPSRKRGNYGKYPWATLMVGGSFFVPGRNAKHMSACAAYHQRVYGQQFTVQDSEEAGQRGCRVWRIA